VRASLLRAYELEFAARQGGTRGIYGDLTNYATEPIKALKAAGSTMVGIGLTPEAVEHNPIVYDLMLEMSWRTEVGSSQLISPLLWLALI